MEQRPSKKWFYTDQGRVCEGTGYQCVPEQPDYWYIPHHGSVHKDRLYEHRGDVRRAAIAWCKGMIDFHQKLMEDLLKE